jgi:hypothetical protein
VEAILGDGNATSCSAGLLFYKRHTSLLFADLLWVRVCFKTRGVLRHTHTLLTFANEFFVSVDGPRLKLFRIPGPLPLLPMFYFYHRFMLVGMVRMFSDDRR